MSNTTAMAKDGGDTYDASSPLVSEKTMRPQNTPWRQQNLKSWSPLFVPAGTIPIFFVLAAIFAPIGGLLLYTSAQVQELTIDYTHCLNTTSTMTPIPASSFTAYFHSPLTPSDLQTYTWSSDPTTKTCTLQFIIPTNLTPPVLFRYKLTNMHTNHRRFSMSRDRAQLLGEARTLPQLQSLSDGNYQCKPLFANTEGKPYYPCGEIANSMFNDTFSSPVRADNNHTYRTTSRGIAWPEDRALYKPTTYNPADIVPPPFWAESYPDGYNSSNIPNLQDWEEFHVWMKMAGLPRFSLLAKRNDHDVLVAGVYRMNITSRFYTAGYSGTKALVISTTSLMGGRGSGLGIAYVVSAVFCALTGFAMTIRLLGCPRKMGDPTYLSWNKPDSYLVRSNKDCETVWEQWVNYCKRNGFP